MAEGTGNGSGGEYQTFMGAGFVTVYVIRHLLGI